VDNSHTRDLADQLAAFSYIADTSPPKEFEGTIVRIPLRTSEQADTSEISTVVVTTQELLSIFEHFQADVAETMPFLKSIERVEFYIDTERLGFTQISNLDHIRDMRAAVKSAILSSSLASHATQIEIHQEYSYGGDHADVRNSSHVYHIRQRVFDLQAESMPEKLKDWTTENKAIPLISLAARLDKPPVAVREWYGRVFITLPLPIRLENTLVNVNSMFAVGRDRRSLWTDNDAPDAQMQPEILWNNFLVRDLMPSVWHDLLIDMTKYESSVYKYFPLMHAPDGLVFNSLIERVLERIIRGGEPIWRSSSGQYLPLENGYILPLNLNAQLLQCLKGIGMPIFEDVPEKIVELLKDHQHPYKNLSPGVLRLWLRHNIKRYSIDDVSTVMHIFEYASADEKMDLLHGLPIFVCKNQSIRSLLLKDTRDGVADFKANVYIGTSEESELFDKQGGFFLDIDQYTAIVMERIRNHMPLMSATMNLEMFNLQSFDLYVRNVLFHNESLAGDDADIINTSQCGIDFVWLQKLWHWLDTHQVNEVKAVVQSRWLTPLEGGDHLFRVCTSVDRMIMR
jgi:sacsin